MSTSMYDRVRHDEPKRKRDPKFYIALVVALALIIGFCVWVWSWNHSRDLFWDFTAGLSSATAASEDGGATVRVDGESKELSVDELYSVYAKLTASEQVRRSNDRPYGDCISFYYANGSSLAVYAADIDVRGWTKDTGIYVEFTYPDGSVYSYITDRVQYSDIYYAVLKN